jgi:hypothetical protein
MLSSTQQERYEAGWHKNSYDYIVKPAAEVAVRVQEHYDDFEEHKFVIDPYSVGKEILQSSIKQALRGIDYSLQQASKLAEKWPLTTIILEGQAEAFFGVLQPFMFAGQKIVEYTGCKEQVDEILDRFVVRQILSASGIKEEDAEYNIGRLTVKTITELSLLKKFDNVAKSQLIYKYLPKVEYYKTGIKYERINGEKAIKQVDLNNVSYNKLESLLLNEGHELSEIQKIKTLFDDTKNWKLNDQFLKPAELISNIDKINNPKVIKKLTKDGSHIEDWKKFKTKSVPTQFGKVQVHFYKNDNLGKINFSEDYKINIGRKKK